MKYKVSSALLTCLAVTILGCGKSSTTPPTSSTSFATNTTAFDYYYSSGSVSPGFAYSVSYKIDFQGKTLVVTTTKGSSVTTPLPISGTKSLIDTQLTQIRTLLGKITYTNCPSGESLTGGGVDGINIYTSSLTIIDSSIWTNNCIGYIGSNQFQSTTTLFQPLTDYLKSL